MRKYKYLVILYLLFLVACNTKKHQTNELSQATQSADAIIVTKINATSTVFPTDSISISTDVPLMTNTVTVTPILMTSSPCPTVPFIITPNADQLAHWQEYERVLAESHLSFLAPEEVLCEWEILGQSEREVYVWAVCSSKSPVGNTGEHSISSIPSVIHLGLDGAIQSADIPGSGTAYARDIRLMFPEDVQERIFDKLIDFRRLSEHLKIRLENQSPPLIVLDATQMP